MEFEKRTENQNVMGSNTLFVVLNTGNSRHRGFEGEISYDLLAPFQQDVAPEPDSKSSSKDMPAPIVSRPLQLIVFSNIQRLDAEFTESALLVPGTTRTLVGNEPAYAPDVIWKGGISFRKEKCFNLTLSGVYASKQFWSDTNLPTPATGPVLVPAIIPSYKVFNFSSEWYITRNVRLIAGVSNLFDEKYYSRIFLNGLIDPAPRRTGYAGISIDF